jgi:arylesterase/paraoxonase
VKKVWLAVLLLVLFLIAFVAVTMFDSGFFKTIQPHFEGTVQVMEGIPGPEDITIDQESGIAFISSDDRRATKAGKPVPGAIYALDLKDTAAIPYRISDGFTRDFHPHGISFLKTEDGKRLLFVINHAQQRHSVEIFAFDGKKLNHLESIRSSLMTSPNDLVAVGPRQFYISNDHGNTGGLGRRLEDYLRLAQSYVLYFDGTKAVKAAEGIAYANGVNLSADGRHLFVTATIGRKLLVYGRDVLSGKLMAEDEIACGTGVDNIELDTLGNLWVGCHPKMLAFVKHAGDVYKKSPSQVLKIQYTGKDNYQMKEIYLNDGTQLSGSSVAAVYQNQMLVGAVFDSKILLARLTQ